ncbi:MAG: hypothetical protein HWE39_01450 [Oceanospirillaceae bacterium]|nr:hypothetical protein [Oceanospirillaceae bacterium]
MEHSLGASTDAVDLSAEALQAFERIATAVERIRDMTTQTASAAEEQQLVTEDINRNIQNISDSANSLSDISDQVERNAANQTALSHQLGELVSRFRT